MPHDPAVGHVRPRQLGDDLAHQFDVVRAARPVVTDGRGHAVREVLLDHGDGQQPPLALVDSFRGLEHHVTVVSVHQLIDVAHRIVVADARHRVAVLPDRQLQQFHLGRRDDVGIVAVRHDLLHRHGPDVVNGTPEGRLSRVFVRAIHISP